MSAQFLTGWAAAAEGDPLHYWCIDDKPACGADAAFDGERDVQFRIPDEACDECSGLIAEFHERANLYGLRPVRPVLLDRRP